MSAPASDRALWSLGATATAQQCLAVRARMISRRLSRVYDAALRPLGVTVAQVNLLSVLQNIGPAPAKRVAELLSMEISTLSRNARIMEREGWVRIESAPHGNGRVIGLAPAGAVKLEEAQPAWERAQAQARELLGERGADELLRIGDRMWEEQLRGA